MAQSERRRISLLLVEDNPDHGHLIERRLQDAGASVKRASTGQEALESLEGVDLVLLDYRLPDMTGLETLEAIHDEGGPSVVMVTGMGSEEIAVEAMRAGAIDYVVKDSTYLSMLPEVVERAWRLHDLARRAGELQRLALLIASVEGRETIFREIAAGASQLLNAKACVLCALQEGRLQVAASVGEPGSSTDDLLASAAQMLSDGGGTQEVDDRLLVSLTNPGEEELGVLVLIKQNESRYAHEEIRLADTFASFAAQVLRNLRQREMEQALITELQQTIELRRDFINSISHELRTPLACISGFSTTVLNHWDRLDPDTIRTSVEKIRHHGSDLTDLVERLLDFGSFEHGQFVANVGTIDLKSELEEAVEVLRLTVPGRTIEAELAQARVKADPQVLRRILTNLVTNAAKASEAGSEIVVRVELLEDAARVEVIDQGVGMSLEDADKAFEPFWRSRHSVKSAARGAGVGLALVKEYVRTMGGQIGVETELGEGSTFWFTLPLSDD